MPRYFYGIPGPDLTVLFVPLGKIDWSPTLYICTGNFHNNLPSLLGRYVSWFSIGVTEMMPFLAAVIEPAQNYSIGICNVGRGNNCQDVKDVVKNCGDIDDVTVASTRMLMLISVTFILVPAEMMEDYMERDITIAGTVTTPNAVVVAAVLTNGGNVDINIGRACHVDGGAKYDGVHVCAWRDGGGTKYDSDGERAGQ